MHDHVRPGAATRWSMTSSGNFIRRSGVDWRSDYDGARALGNSPVMHVSVRDAENYAAWLSEQTGRSYRLPSEAEFEYALRAGNSGRYPGETPVRRRRAAATSPAARTSRLRVGTGTTLSSAMAMAGGDRRRWPVSRPMLSACTTWPGICEWVADCWHASYRRAPSDGVAWFNPGCRSRVIRGGNWANAPEQLVRPGGNRRIRTPPMRASAASERHRASPAAGVRALRLRRARQPAGLLEDHRCATIPFPARPKARSDAACSATSAGGCCCWRRAMRCSTGSPIAPSIPTPARR